MNEQEMLDDGDTMLIVQPDNLCFWSPAIEKYAATSEVETQLHENGWAEVVDDQMLLVIMCRFGQIYALDYDDGKETLWAHTDMIKAAQQTPIILACMLDYQRYVADIAPDTPSDQPLRISIQQPVPLPAWGTIGGTFSMMYGISRLGEEAIALQARLSEALKSFTMPDYWGETKTGATEAATDDATGQRWRREMDPDEYHRAMSEIAGMAAELSLMYWTYYQTQQPPSGLKRIPQIPDIFTFRQASIPTPLPVQAVLGAFSNAQTRDADKWREKDGLPTFTQSKDAGITRLQMRPEPQAIVDETTTKSLWKTVRKLNDLDGDVFLAMLAQALLTTNAANDSIWIMASLILDYRGVQPIMKREGDIEQRHGHRTEDILAVGESIGRMALLWVNVQQHIITDTKGRKELWQQDSRLINIEETMTRRQMVPSESEPGETSGQNAHIVAWRFKIGTWIEPFLAGPNRQLGYLTQNALSYDPYRHFWEKRLARYFIFHLRINASGGNTIKRKIGPLIDELHLPILERYPEKTRRRFEQAMDRLVEDEQIDAWRYAGDNDELPPRKWIATWLSWAIEVTASPMTSNLFKEIQQKALESRAKLAELGPTRKPRRKKTPSE